MLFGYFYASSYTNPPPTRGLRISSPGPHLFNFNFNFIRARKSKTCCLDCAWLHRRPQQPPSIPLFFPLSASRSTSPNALFANLLVVACNLIHAHTTNSSVLRCTRLAKQPEATTKYLPQLSPRIISVSFPCLLLQPDSQRGLYLCYLPTSYLHLGTYEPYRGIHDPPLTWPAPATCLLRPSLSHCLCLFQLPSFFSAPPSGEDRRYLHPACGAVQHLPQPPAIASSPTNKKEGSRHPLRTS